MKKTFFLLLVISFIGLSVCSTSSANAQGVGINPSGNAPDPSAIIDVSSATKGMLIPRVSLLSTTDASTIATPATYLTVYNTNATMANGNGVGVYYYNGNHWVYMA